MNNYVKKFFDDDRLLSSNILDPTPNSLGDEKYIEINIDDFANTIIKNKKGEWVELEDTPLSKLLKVELDNLRNNSYDFIFCEEAEFELTDSEYKKLILDHAELGVFIAQKIKKELFDWEVIYVKELDGERISL